jgi:hypothetical protein
VFPCANGAVSDILSAHALQGVQLVDIDTLEVVASKSNQAIKKKKNTSLQPEFRRFQILHILDCAGPANRQPPKTARLGSTSLLIIFEFVVLISLLGVCIVTVLFGLYGTATAVLITVLFRISRQLIHIDRPSGYLANEPNAPTACMLVALHENASIWYLYQGSRSVVDTLLNKPMIQSITSPLSVWLPQTLRALEILQLVAMTYVTA